MGDLFVYAITLQSQAQANGSFTNYSTVLTNTSPIDMDNYGEVVEKVAKSLGLEKFCVMNLSILSWPNMTGNKP